jgi:hypothetical protein
MRRGGDLVVAGEHDDLHAHVAERRYCGRARNAPTLRISGLDERSGPAM